jgi:hypothetical protein
MQGLNSPEGPGQQVVQQCSSQRRMRVPPLPLPPWRGRRLQQARLGPNGLQAISLIACGIMVTLASCRLPSSGIRFWHACSTSTDCSTLHRQHIPQAAPPARPPLRALLLPLPGGAADDLVHAQDHLSGLRCRHQHLRGVGRDGVGRVKPCVSSRAKEDQGRTHASRSCVRERPAASAQPLPATPASSARGGPLPSRA